MAEKANLDLITDQRYRDNRMVMQGSRRLCAAILREGRTHGPCDVHAAIAYAHSVDIKG